MRKAPHRPEGTFCPAYLPHRQRKRPHKGICEVVIRIRRRPVVVANDVVHGVILRHADDTPALLPSELELTSRRVVRDVLVAGDSLEACVEALSGDERPHSRHHVIDWGHLARALEDHRPGQEAVNAAGLCTHTLWQKQCVPLH